MDFHHVKTYQDSLIDRFAVGTGLSVYKKDREVYCHFNGFADREKGIPISMETLFHMYSLTKPLVCALALMIFEEGGFSLTDPVSKFLPEYAHLMVLGEDGLRPARSQMRIIHLFTMTSGLNYDLDAISGLLMKNGQQTTARQAAAFLAKRPLDFDPGSRYLYSFSHDVLAVVLEVITGRSLGELLKERLFLPLNMHNSFFQVPKEKEHLLAQTYQLEPPFFRLHDAHALDHFPRFESGGGGLVMSLHDYLLFTRMLARGGSTPSGQRLMKPETLRLFYKNQLKGEVLTGYQEKRPGYGYGLGVRVMMDPQAIQASSQVDEYGWSGMMGTYFLVQPQEEVCAVFVTQMMPGPNRPVHAQLRDVICQAVLL